ncbi:MAG: hypothetical protein KGH68_03705 [Patescibacteria group bacterium]|nr:hypothetical protein [Patescibacteria group bacterium]
MDCGCRIVPGHHVPCFDLGQKIRLDETDLQKQTKIVVFVETTEDIKNAPFFVTQWGYKKDYDTARGMIPKRHDQERLRPQVKPEGDAVPTGEQSQEAA